MSHFAKIENNIVTQVIVAEQDVINSGLFGSPSSWIQTSYNTYAGEHRLGGTPLRKNYAGIGFTYDNERDAFIPPKPFNSWILDEGTCLWNSPVPMPTDSTPPTTETTGISYTWNEETTSWDKVVLPKLTAQ
jgi:hypothetical protein